MDLALAVRHWALGLGSTALKMLGVLVAIFIVLEFAQHYGILDRSLRFFGRLTRFMGLDDRATLPWLAGNVFGIVFGAGVITDAVRARALGSRQVVLVSTFLALCHGLIEDTALFVVLGANVFWILVPRIILGIGVTWVLSRIVREPAT